MHDSAVWQKRFPNLAERDPIGIYDRRTRIIIENGQEISRIFGIDTRQGQLIRMMAPILAIPLKNIWMTRYMAPESNNNENVWIEMRFAEIILNYAEACLGLK